MLENLFAKKYPLPDPEPSHLGLFDTQEIILAPNSHQVVGTSNWAVEWIIVSVTTGVLGIRPGVQSGGNPIWRFRAGEAPVYLPVGFTGGSFSLSCTSFGTDTCQAAITFVSRANHGFDYSRALR